MKGPGLARAVTKRHFIQVRQTGFHAGKQSYCTLTESNRSQLGTPHGLVNLTIDPHVGAAISPVGSV